MSNQNHCFVHFSNNLVQFARKIWLFERICDILSKIFEEQEMQKILKQWQFCQEIIKITLSDTTTYEYKKVIIHPVCIKNQVLWQIEKHTADKVYHSNVTANAVQEFLSDFGGQFRQITFYYPDKTIIFAKRGYTYHAKTTEVALAARTQVHNREKHYILAEGDQIPAFVDLGIFNSDYTIAKTKFDKFKQINRFVEILDEAIKDEPRDEFVVLDFGCGKSYLTFIIYYYLTQVRHIKAKIIGYDLKEDVVDKCNQIAQKYGYDNLKFYVNDVSKGALYEGKIDMIVTLHACDTATDYALDYAIKNEVKYIFSVPCCQHEINQQIAPNGDYDILLKHGLIKERFSALLTDAIRAEILSQHGYTVDLLEFVDFANSPKNILFRAKKTTKSKPQNFDIAAICARYGFEQTLFKLTQK